MDPATAKLLLKLSARIAADKESRKRIVLLIVAPIIAFLLLVSLVLQILTSPIESLKLMLNTKETPVVDELRVDYGFTQALQASDDGYVESLGQQYEGVTFKMEAEKLFTSINSIHAGRICPMVLMTPLALLAAGQLHCLS